MGDDNHFDDRILLKDLIRQVRTELAEAVSEREQGGGNPMFVLNKLTLEVNFTVERGKAVEAGVSGKVWALVGVKAGGNLNAKTEQVHKITLELSPFSASTENHGDLSAFKSMGATKDALLGSTSPFILETIDNHLQKKYPVILKDFFKENKFKLGADGKLYFDVGPLNLPGS